MIIHFSAPRESLYYGYGFKVNVELDENYPVTAPIVSFATKIYHPNIDYENGFPCISALENENWNEESSLENSFDYVLPQLLCQPNFEDPYNTEASELLRESEEEYEEKVKGINAYCYVCEAYAEEE
ncbi:ubiquitin-conjugating enzyme E2-23 kDa [Daucus carota subsp. sativus]|uniref:ubiquitin-conjugating enzyme E2-23 kDa n=1 Tax=Daucus carota subsp. sativus TaxID=79200 RepID=UPI003082FBDF